MFLHIDTPPDKGPQQDFASVGTQAIDGGAVLPPVHCRGALHRCFLFPRAGRRTRHPSARVFCERVKNGTQRSRLRELLSGLSVQICPSEHVQSDVSVCTADTEILTGTHYTHPHRHFQTSYPKRRIGHVTFSHLPAER